MNGAVDEEAPVDVVVVVEEVLSRLVTSPSGFCVKVLDAEVVVVVVVVPEPSPLPGEAFLLVPSLRGRETFHPDVKKSVPESNEEEEGVSDAFRPRPPVTPPSTLSSEKEIPDADERVVAVVAETLAETPEDGGKMFEAEVCGSISA